MEFAGALTGKGRIRGAMINGVYEAFLCFGRDLFPVSFPEKSVKLCMKAQRPGSQIVPDEKYRCCGQEQEGGGNDFFQRFMTGRHVVFHDGSFPKKFGQIRPTGPRKILYGFDEISITCGGAVYKKIPSDLTS